MSSRCLFSSQGLPSGNGLSLSQGPPPCQRQRPCRASIKPACSPALSRRRQGFETPWDYQLPEPVLRLSPPIFPETFPPLFESRLFLATSASGSVACLKTHFTDHENSPLSESQCRNYLRGERVQRSIERLINLVIKVVANCAQARGWHVYVA